MRLHRPTLVALAALTTLTSSSSAPAQTASSRTECEVCIPADYRAACDGYRRGLATCREDREQDARELAAVRQALAAEKALAVSQGRRAAQAEAQLAAAPSVAGVVGVTLATTCLATLGVAGARWGVGGELDLWLVGVGVVQCVGGGLVLGWSL